MKISPVSFGRAIKINSNANIAQRIVDAANGNICILGFPTEKEKAINEFSQKIFNDTYLSNGSARVVQTSPEDVFIFSGKEAELATKLIKDANSRINENNKFVDLLPDRICRAEQKKIYEKQNKMIQELTLSRLFELVENGQVNKRVSVIDVEFDEDCENPKKASFSQVKKLTYTSCENDVKEKITYTKKN